MTPEERAVIDAARAYVAYYWGDDAPGSAEAAALYRAVRALPRPLSERLAELRPGAVVEMQGDNDATEVLCVDRPSGTFFGTWDTYDGERLTASFNLSGITRIISNPEADRG